MEPHDHSPERSAPLMPEELAREMGFIESDDMRLLRDEIRRLAGVPEASGQMDEIIARYRQLAEAVVERQHGSDYARAQIGRLIATATVRRDAGRIDHYLEDLADAATYAYNLGLDDLTDQLDACIARGEEGYHGDEATPAE